MRKRGTKKRVLVGGVSVLLAVCGMLALLQPEETVIRLMRPAAGGLASREEILLETEDGFASFYVEVNAREYEDTEIEQMQERTREYLLQVLTGENDSLERVTKNLVFPENAPEGGGKISWSTDKPWIVDNNGQVENQSLTEAETVTVQAKVYYGTEYRVFERQITVYPKEYTEEETELLEVKKELEDREEKTRTKPYLEFPARLRGKQVRLAEKEPSAGVVLLFVAGFFPVLMYLEEFSLREKRRRTRETAAREGFAEFMAKLSLLMAAGLSGRVALKRLEREYRERCGEQYVLSEELKMLRQELENGVAEQTAYENFGNRIGQVPYQRLASLLAQNATKGVQGLRKLLLEESKEVLAAERANVRIRGEQAGTKLLLPMTGLLVLVFAVLLVPAMRMF